MSLDKIQKVILGREEERRKPIPFRIKKQLLIASKGRCMWCAKQSVQEFHHIDGNPKHNKIGNIAPLCGTCHNRVHNGEITKEQLWKRLGVKPKHKQKVLKHP